MQLVPSPAAGAEPLIDFGKFLGVEIRVVRVVDAKPLRTVRNPAYLLTIDLGDATGVKTTSAQSVSITF